MKAQTLGQFEKNVSVSFGYVKKDLLMVNDSVSDLHDKIQHLSLNQAMLLEKVMKLERMVLDSKTKVVKQKTVAKKAKKAKKVVGKKPVKKVVKETTTYQ